MKFLNNILIMLTVFIFVFSFVSAEETLEPVLIAEEKDDYQLFCESVQEMIGAEEIVLPGFVPVKNELVQVYDMAGKPILNLKIEAKVLKTVECGLNEDFTYKGNFDIETLISLRDAEDKVARLKDILDKKEGKVKGVGPINSVKAFLFKIGLKIFG